MSDLQAWLSTYADDPSPVATFVVDAEGVLLLADRHEEHVRCAGGERVRSAGEMFFALEGDQVVLEQVTNQSTGYCPEPTSWPEVEAALDRLGIDHPGSFTLALEFRRCEACGQIAIIKDSEYVCLLCHAPLPRHYNVFSPCSSAE